METLCRPWQFILRHQFVLGDLSASLEDLSAFCLTLSYFTGRSMNESRCDCHIYRRSTGDCLVLLDFEYIHQNASTSPWKWDSNKTSVTPAHDQLCYHFAHPDFKNVHQDTGKIVWYYRKLRPHVLKSMIPGSLAVVYRLLLTSLLRSHCDPILSPYDHVVRLVLPGWLYCVITSLSSEHRPFALFLNMHQWFTLKVAQGDTLSSWTISK
jgi:hypothetical protein